MSKSVKLLARAGEEVVCVGRCHPGEARILRKNGFAEWSNDHGGLVLNLSAPADTGVGEGHEPWAKLKAFLDAQNAKPTDPKGFPVIDTDPRTLSEIRATIGMWSPAESFTVDDEGNPVRVTSEVEQIMCKTAAEWFGHIADGRRVGHTLYPCDDPKARQLGFVDHEEDKAYMVSIFRVSGMSDEDLAPMVEFGLTPADVRQLMRTEVGHHKLLGCGDLTFARGDLFAEMLPSKMGDIPTHKGPQITEDELDGLIGAAQSGKDWFSEVLAVAVAREKGLDVPLDPEHETMYADDDFVGTSEEFLAACGNPDGWVAFDHTLWRDNRFTFSRPPEEDFTALPRLPAIGSETEDGVWIVFRGDWSIGVTIKTEDHLVWDQRCSVRLQVRHHGPSGFRDAKHALRTALHRSDLGKLLRTVPFPAPAKTPPGWSSFAYPKDFDRVPLFDPEGNPIKTLSGGLFRRVRGGVWIIPQGGHAFFATMRQWTLAELSVMPQDSERGARRTGYGVPVGADLSDHGVPLPEAVGAAQAER